jgi:hypothetical protein
VITVHYLAPNLVASEPLGPKLQTGFGVLALLTYLAAQAVKPRPPVVAVVRRARAEQA